MVASIPLGAIDGYLFSQHMKGLSHLDNGQAITGKRTIWESFLQTPENPMWEILLFSGSIRTVLFQRRQE